MSSAKSAATRASGKSRSSRSSSRSRSRSALFDPEPLLVKEPCVLREPLNVQTRQQTSLNPVTGEIVFVAETFVLSADSPRATYFRTDASIIASSAMTEAGAPSSSTLYTAFVGTGALLMRRVISINRGSESNAFTNIENRAYQYACPISIIDRDGRPRRASRVSILTEVHMSKTDRRFNASERTQLAFDAGALKDGDSGSFPLVLERQMTQRDRFTSFDERVAARDSTLIDVVRYATVRSSDSLWTGLVRVNSTEHRFYKLDTPAVSIARSVHSEVERNESIFRPLDEKTTIKDEPAIRESGASHSTSAASSGVTFSGRQEDDTLFDIPSLPFVHSPPGYPYSSNVSSSRSLSKKSFGEKSNDCITVMPSARSTSQKILPPPVGIDHSSPFKTAATPSGCDTSVGSPPDKSSPHPLPASKEDDPNTTTQSVNVTLDAADTENPSFFPHRISLEAIYDGRPYRLQTLINIFSHASCNFVPLAASLDGVVLWEKKKTEDDESTERKEKKDKKDT